MDKTTKLTDQFGSMKMSNMEGTMNIFLHKLPTSNVYIKCLTLEHQLRKREGIAGI